jgi:hypothetical protein
MGLSLHQTRTKENASVVSGLLASRRSVRVWFEHSFVGGPPHVIVMSGDAATSASGATLGAASVRTLATRTSMRWLLAIAMPCQSPGAGPGRERAFTEADIRNYGGPNFHVFVNIFDSNTSCLSPQCNSLPYVHVSFAKGYMTHFWKEVLTPTVTRAFDIVALKDADMLLSPHTIQLSEVEYWMRRTNASLIVPTIAPEAPKGRAGRESSKQRPRHILYIIDPSSCFRHPALHLRPRELS